MKLPAFEYATPESVEQVLQLLASAGGDAKIIAGGQSLLPAMAFRLANPRLLVDLARVPGLEHIQVGPSGVRIGARTRWRTIEDEPRLARAQPLLQAAVRQLAHYQVRNRGTVGGSLAHADPAAELPGIATACDAEIRVASPQGERTIAARDFFIGPLSTSLREDEMILDIRFPAWPAGRRWAFQKFARRSGDFALAGIALHYDPDGAGRLRDVHVGVLGACQRPMRLARTEAVLEGATLEEAVIDQACRCAHDEADPSDDMHATADYRRALVATLLRRALRQADGTTP